MSRHISLIAAKSSVSVSGARVIIRIISAYLSEIWPEWKVEKQLGRGSYGVVYKAARSDSNVQSYAAIKVITIPSDESEVDSLRSEGLDMNGTRTYFKGIVDDFVSEIQLMETMKGIQNIVSVEDYKVVEKKDTVGWDIYIRMELLTPFNSFVCDKKLTEKEVIKLGIDICSALEICGKRNVIHRDIKPENIFTQLINRQTVVHGVKKFVKIARFFAEAVEFTGKGKGNRTGIGIENSGRFLVETF